MTIVKHELRQGWKNLAIWTGAIGFFMVVCVLLFPQMKTQAEGMSEAFASMGAPYNFGYRVFADIPASLAPGTDSQVTITESMSSKEIAQDFEEIGLVEDWKLFWTQMQFSEHKDEITPGVYTLNNSMKAEEMLEIISASGEEEEEE